MVYGGQWFKGYHNKGIMSAIIIARDHSDRVPNDHGTAQGSILSPTEYLIYINDMCNLFHSSQGSKYCGEADAY
ncbi:unnamed protein product [Parnassius apollo]|uniref:(apollo) hypothetical protein n=1 Tax=Parnassius apollo TaxID=110799 RepID=A0A8S3XTR7_PARAO|nr:unnamed protein product [Parnassius apollo]